MLFFVSENDNKADTRKSHSEFLRNILKVAKTRFAGPRDPWDERSMIFKIEKKSGIFEIFLRII